MPPTTARGQDDLCSYISLIYLLSHHINLSQNRTALWPSTRSWINCVWSTHVNVTMDESSTSMVKVCLVSRGDLCRMDQEWFNWELWHTGWNCCNLVIFVPTIKHSDTVLIRFKTASNSVAICKIRSAQQFQVSMRKRMLPFNSAISQDGNQRFCLPKYNDQCYWSRRGVVVYVGSHDQ